MPTPGLTGLDSPPAVSEHGALLRRLAAWCGVAVSILGVLGLAGGLTGHLVWGRLHTSSIPMALSTSLMFMAIGWILARPPGFSPESRGRRRLCAILAAMVIAEGLLDILDLWGRGTELDPFDILAARFQTWLGIAFKPMSPVTGSLFVVLGASLLLLTVRFGAGSPGRGRRGTAGVLAGLVAVAGLTLLLGYAWGSPFLYGSEVVPVALATSIAFLTAGAGVVCAAGPDALPLRPFLGNSIRARLLRAFTPVMALSALVYPVLIKLLLIAEINNALLTSLWAVFFAGIASALVIQVGRTIGRDLDRAETLRDQAERSLRISEERFREFIEGTDNIVTQVDGNGRLLYVNRVAAELFGCAPDECVGRSAIDMVFPEDRERTRQAFQEWTRQRLDRGTFENRQAAASGDPRTLFWNMHFHYDEAGSLAYVNSIAQDITERKHAEDSLRNALEFNDKILAHSPVAIGVYDGRTGQCLRANPMMAEVVGASRDQLLAQNFRRLESWGRSGLLNLAEKVLAGGGPDRMDFKLRTTFGKEVTLDCILARMEMGGVPYLLLMAADITERSRYEEMMVQTEKMMSLGGLAAGMAHEINNPLSGILQSIQVVQLRTARDTPRIREAALKAGCQLEAVHRFLEDSEVYSLLQSVRDAGARAAKIVANMLEFSAKAESKKVPVDLGVLLDKSVELCSNDYDLKKKYDFRKIRIDRDYAPDLPPVPCTATQIEQVIMNILRNAAQAMADRPATAPPPRIILRTGRENGGVRIEVEDNGPGMEETIRRRIFEPFFTTKEPGIGTGLGLSVSYFIIARNHRGTIRVESAPGKGSLFVITLPLAQEAVAAPTP